MRAVANNEHLQIIESMEKCSGGGGVSLWVVTWRRVMVFPLSRFFPRRSGTGPTAVSLVEEKIKLSDRVGARDWLEQPMAPQRPEPPSKPKSLAKTHLASSVT